MHYRQCRQTAKARTRRSGAADAHADAHRHGAAPDRLRVLVLSIDDVEPIDASLLFSCQLHIAADALPGRHPVACRMALASTPDGEAIAPPDFRCHDGAVIVAAPPARPTPAGVAGIADAAGSAGADGGCRVGGDSGAAGDQRSVVPPAHASDRLKRGNFRGKRRGRM